MGKYSPFAAINWSDIKKTAFHFLVVAVASFALYLVDTVLPSIHFTGNVAIMTTIVSTMSDLARRFLTNYTK